MEGDMESDILEALEDLGYKGSLMDDGALIQAASQGAFSPEYTKLCAWLVAELKLFCKIEESVEATNSPAEADGFQLEISGLLTEMNCPYSSLTSGDVTKRLLDKRNCLLLLTYLISELEAARMLNINLPAKKEQEGGGSEVFTELKTICVTLGMSKPPPNITMFQFFSGIEKKVKETLAKVSPNHMGKPLLNKTLGPSHWEKIEAINQAITNEYEIRRKMLIKRLDVTVQSFGWSDRAKSQSDKLAKVYQPKRATLASRSSISVAHLLSARHDLSKILRTSSGSIREKTACAINKVLMGRVPDRGGRPNEIEPPPPEMPPWQKRQDGPPQGGGRGGGRGGYEQSYGGRGSYEHGGGGRGGFEHGGGGRGGYEHGGGSHGGGGRGGYEHGGGGRGGYDHGGGRGGYEQGGGRGRGSYDQGNRGGRGNKIQGGWTEGGGSGSGGHYQDGVFRDSGFQSGGYQSGGGGYQSGGYQAGGGGYQGGGGGGYGGYQGSSYSGSGYQGGGYQQENRFQDGGHHNDRGGGRGGGRGNRGGRGGRGGQGGGWGGRGAQTYNQGGQFEQHFQHGGYQYNQSGFGQGRHYTS